MRTSSKIKIVIISSILLAFISFSLIALFNIQRANKIILKLDSYTKVVNDITSDKNYDSVKKETEETVMGIMNLTISTMKEITIKIIPNSNLRDLEMKADKLCTDLNNVKDKLNKEFD